MAKRVRVCALLFAAVLLLGGCRAQTESADAAAVGIFDFCGDAWEVFAAQFSAEKIDHVIYRFTEDTAKRRDITDPDEIQALFDALCQVQVAGESEIRATDSEQSIVFVTKENGSYCLEFEGGNLLLDGKAYCLTGAAALHAWFRAHAGA